MPSLTHMIYGLSLILPVMLIARDRINYKAALIFILCNYIGPDSFYPYIFIPLYGHSILGYIVWAAFLALMYSYISRFTISRKGFKFSIHDDGRIEVPYRQAYMLCLAGGICHFFIDMIGHRGFNLYLTQWDDTSLHDIQAWGNAYYHNFGVISILSFVMILIVILLLFQVLQQESKSQYLFILGVMAAIVLITLLIDGQIFAELEMTMVVVIGLYFLFPLTLLYKALSEVFEYNQKQLKEPSERSPRKLNSDQIFKLIVVFLGLLVFALIIAGIVVLGMAEEISTRFGYAEELFTLGSIAVIVLAIFLGITTVLLALKKEFARKIIIGICFMAFITIITMVIAFALCEKDIKEQFH